MITSNLEKVFESFFKQETLDFLKDQSQYGFNNFIEKDIKRIGLSIDLTREVIEKAKEQHIDLILTHHNIWEDFYEWREDCLKLLEEYQIVHYFNHLALDSVSFGPTGMLVKELGLNPVLPFCKMEDLAFGMIGEFSEPITLNELKVKLETYCGHDIRVWKNNDKLVKRVGVVGGSGADVEILREAYLYQCDAFITGEKSSKSLLYCKHIGLNFLLGSHAFTEYKGLLAYADLIQSKVTELEFISLQEKHYE